MNIFTIGYGGRDRKDFLVLMQANGVRTVVDVRLRPDRSRLGLWAKAATADKGLEKWLADAGFGYRSLIELGNTFMAYPDWRKRYRQLLDLAGDLLTQHLMDIPGPICLFCAEKRAADCHRLQLADFLIERKGATVRHLE